MREFRLIAWPAKHDRRTKFAGHAYRFEWLCEIVSDYKREGTDRYSSNAVSGDESRILMSGLSTTLCPDSLC
jgi:hypothetical protein